MRIIACDYDGTLNNNDGVTDEKRAAINKWREAGNLFGLVSGRSVDALPEILKENPFEYDFFIGYNGGIITDAEGKVLFEKRADGKLVKPIMEKFLEWGAHKCFVHSDKTYFVVPEKTEKYPDAILLEDLPETESFNQITAIFPLKEMTLKAFDKFRELFGENLNPLQNSRLIDVVPEGIDKARGIYKFMELMNISYDDVIVIGNDVNDYEMISEFNSYAVENATEEILKTAKHITYDIVSLINTLMSE